MIKNIANDKKDKNGTPLWVLCKDGRLFLSADAVKKAAISKAYIKS
ncbi:hypothetical protein [Pseudomonas sp. TNT3]|nr:hypothetical protein [Pseudomonas sp. TNT3]KAI2693235.1 hypothetical protein GBC55_006800 [Pseudomonas sp. TNT3]